MTRTLAHLFWLESRFTVTRSPCTGGASLGFGAELFAIKAESLYRKAIGEGRESVIAAIFWLKTRARWKETMVNEVTHDVADPLNKLMQDIAERGRRVHDQD